VTFRAAPESEVHTQVTLSLDGFSGEGPGETHQFFVRDPEARWVRNNLLDPMHSEPAPGGIRVSCQTAATLRLARFVIGLGAAARAETPALVELVLALAKGALTAHRPRAKSLRSNTAAPVQTLPARNK
jgi:hypothetical protein